MAARIWVSVIPLQRQTYMVGSGVRKGRKRRRSNTNANENDCQQYLRQASGTARIFAIILPQFEP